MHLQCEYCSAVTRAAVLTIRPAAFRSLVSRSMRLVVPKTGGSTVLRRRRGGRRAQAPGARAPSASGFSCTTGGAMVPLSAIAHYEQQRTALQVNHQGQYPAVTLSFNMAPNVALG